jgi:hypothetical protein
MPYRILRFTRKIRSGRTDKSEEPFCGKTKNGTRVKTNAKKTNPRCFLNKRLIFRIRFGEAEAVKLPAPSPPDAVIVKTIPAQNTIELFRNFSF